ncbi:hypothetical protein C6558_27285 [Ensifer sp. NM-2]|nr:hypothetical protein C6558_27285 [Ensifer sp. NM-2]
MATVSRAGAGHNRRPRLPLPGLIGSSRGRYSRRAFPVESEPRKRSISFFTHVLTENRFALLLEMLQAAFSAV